MVTDVTNSTMTVVLVPKAVAHRVAAFVLSIWTHFQYCQLLGHNVHFASHAAALAKPLIGNRLYIEAIHHSSNLAKHIAFVVSPPCGVESFQFNIEAYAFYPCRLLTSLAAVDSFGS
jgi:hypothetical protein